MLFKNKKVLYVSQDIDSIRKLEKEMRKYQLTNYTFNLCKNYQILKIKSFTDMLEISDTINQPILMKENNEKTGAYFLIMTGFKVIYIYKLNVSTIHETLDQDI